MKHPASPRVVALVGPQGRERRPCWSPCCASREEVPSKPREQGPASGRTMTVELAAATTGFMGERWIFIDCPGAPEFSQEAKHALMVCDAALVVCDTGPERAAALSPLFHFLDTRHIPHLLFLNAQNESGASLRALLESLQVVSARPLVLREIPLREGDRMVGVVDLVSERAWGTTAEQEAALIPLPETDRPLEEAARRQMLERLADQDDALLEQLIEDMEPSPGVLYEQMAQALCEDRLVPVFIGSAERGLGLLRLLKGLRHEVPGVEETRTRLGISASGSSMVQPFKLWHLPHVGKQVLARIWRGTVVDGGTLGGGRVSGVLQPHGAQQTSVGTAHEGDVAILGRVDAAHIGDRVEVDGVRRVTDWPAAPPPVHQVSITAAEAGG